MPETREQYNARKVRETRARRADPVKYAEYVAKYTAYNKANAEKQRLYMQKDRQENPEKHREARKRSRKKHAAKCKQYRKAYWEKNRERLIQQNKDWKAKHKDRVQQHNRTGGARYRMLKKEQDRGLTAEEWEQQVEVFNGQCAYCLAPATELEHMQPIALGGYHEIDNVVPACRRCNSSKWKKPLLQWLLTSEIAQEALQ